MNIRKISAGLPGTILRVLVCAAAVLQPAGGNVSAQNPPAVALRIIVVDSPSLADRVAQRLKNGEDFAALARELSIDPTASDGGSMGQVDSTSLRSELRDALKGIVPGQITGVVRVPA